MNRVCEILGIEKPVIQGPMAWISTAPLVAAVSNAGGLGVLGVGFAPEEFIRMQIMAETQNLVRATDKSLSYRERLWNTSHDIIEDIGMGARPHLHQLQISRRFGL